MSNSCIRLCAVICFLCVHLGFANEPGCTLSQNNPDIKSAAANECARPIEINHAVIQIVDGTPRADVYKMIILRNNLKKLREVEKGKGLIAYNGADYTLKQLVMMEQDQVLDKKMFPKVLEAALNTFEGMSTGYLNEARAFKSLMLSVISQWATQRNKADSILLQWGSQPAGTEHAHLRKTIVSFALLDQFVGDLICFLMDMSSSCKQSMKIFKDLMAKQSAHK